MNTITKNWCNYTGWNATCWELFNDQPYFGGNGYVGRAWYTQSDNGSNINGTALQAFSAFESPGQLKRFTMSKPIFRTSGSPAIYSNINIDFNLDVPATTLNFTPTSSGTWDNATWDVSTWGGGLNVLQQWQGLNGVGYYGAPVVKTLSAQLNVSWVGTDIVIEGGAIL